MAVHILREFGSVEKEKINSARGQIVKVEEARGRPLITVRMKSQNTAISVHPDDLSRIASLLKVSPKLLGGCDVTCHVRAKDSRLVGFSP